MRNLFTALLMGFMGSSLWAADTVEVLEVRGEAAIRSGLEGKWTPLEKGALIQAGQWIQTSFGSRVYLKFWNNTVTQVRSASLVKLETVHSKGLNQKGRLRLALGSVRVNIREDRKEIVDFRVESPRLTTAVKGTYFSVESRGYNDNAKVWRGKLAIFLKGLPTVHWTPTDDTLDASLVKTEGLKRETSSQTMEEEEVAIDSKSEKKRESFTLVESRVEMEKYDAALFDERVENGDLSNKPKKK